MALQNLPKICCVIKKIALMCNEDMFLPLPNVCLGYAACDDVLCIGEFPPNTLK